MNIVRDALLFRAGDYPDKDIHWSERDISEIVAAFPETGAPVSFGHADPDALPVRIGLLERIWQRGAELYGRILYNADAFRLLSNQNSRALSIGIDLDTKVISEVSHVAWGRVPTAHAMFSGAKVFDLSFDDKTEMIRQAMYELASMREGGYIEGVYDDYVVVCTCEQGLLRYPYTISGAGVAFGEPESVEREYVPRELPAEESAGGNMGTTKQPQGLVTRLLSFLRGKGVELAESELADALIDPAHEPTTNQADLSALETKIEGLTAMVAGLTATVQTFSTDRKQRAEVEVDEFLNAQLKAGRIVAAEKPGLRAQMLCPAKISDASGDERPIGEIVRETVLARPTMFGRVSRASLADGSDDPTSELTEAEAAFCERMGMDPRKYAAGKIAGDFKDQAATYAAVNGKGA